MPHYDLFPTNRVDSRARNLAAVALTDVCPILKMSKPALKWFSETRFGAKWFENDVLGWCAKDGQTCKMRKRINSIARGPIFFGTLNRVNQLAVTRRVSLSGGVKSASEQAIE